MEPPVWAWIALVLGVPLMAAIDLIFFGRGGGRIPVRRAAAWTVGWVALGLSFAVLMALTQGGRAAGEYLSGYLIEWSLSVDNLFVFAMIFAYFAVPAALQPRVLLYGILGALVFRGAFIAVGAAALDAAAWVVYVFGAFLVATAVRLATHRGEQVDPGNNALLRIVNRWVPSTSEYHGNRVFVRVGGSRMATPFLAVLLVVASTDILFAIDSIPAIFAVTDEAFIVLAANAFALMGLRAAFFVIVGALDRFRYLSHGLAVVLALVGVKMLLKDVYHPPIAATLGAVVVVLGTAVLASAWATRREERSAAHEGGSQSRSPYERLPVVRPARILLTLLLAALAAASSRPRRSAPAGPSSPATRSARSTRLRSSSRTGGSWRRGRRAAAATCPPPFASAPTRPPRGTPSPGRRRSPRRPAASRTSRSGPVWPSPASGRRP